MITLILDKPRHLKFTSNAIADAEAVMAKNLIGILSEAGVRAVKTLLWAGLKWEDRTLTLERAGDLIDLWKESKPYEELEDQIVAGLKADGWVKEIARQQQEDVEAAGGCP